MSEHAFTIPLEPVPASRARTTRWGSFYLPRYEGWRQAARSHCPALGLAGPVRVRVQVICKRPQRLTTPWARGDADNYTKAVFDAMTKAGTWHDDVQVVDMHVTKRYAEKDEPARCEVQVCELPPPEGYKPKKR